MRRFAAVLSSFVFAVLFTILLMPRTGACPVSAPVPLRGLYFKSDIVVVGKIGTPTKWTALPVSEDQNQRYQPYSRIVPIQIEEIIKGAPPKKLEIMETQNQWVGDTMEQKPPPVGVVKTPDAPPDLYSRLAENKERRVFFLYENGNDDGYYGEIYTSRSFAPAQKDLPLFISRLRELHGIYSAPAPSKQMIVEWLVTMAEDPVTRWEGAYELSQALSREDDDEDEPKPAEDANGGNVKNAESKESVSEQDDKTVDGAPIVSAEQLQQLPAVYINSAYTGIERDYSDIPKLLTAAQKERLISAFLNVRFTYKEVERPKDNENEDAESGDEEEEAKVEYEPVLNDADDDLMTLVSNFKDRRVIDRLIGELPAANKYNAWQTSRMIDILAAYFDDDKLSDLSEKYSDVNWEDDDELIESEDEAYDKPAEDAEGEESSDGDNSVEPETSANDRADEKARADVYVPTKTYGQRRAELIQQILTRIAEIGVKG